MLPAPSCSNQGTKRVCYKPVRRFHNHAGKRLLVRGHNWPNNRQLAQHDTIRDLRMSDICCGIDGGSCCRAKRLTSAHKSPGRHHAATYRSATNLSALSGSLAIISASDCWIMRNVGNTIGESAQQHTIRGLITSGISGGIDGRSCCTAQTLRTGPANHALQ